mmetsp:Transcript_29792/g.72175  ORF Transcript_29792/g.72175 Transcript_29792/m.72175 type:complete len:82 (+) Transcript_29792:70-315(+)
MGWEANAPYPLCFVNLNSILSMMLEDGVVPTGGTARFNNDDCDAGVGGGRILNTPSLKVIRVPMISNAVTLTTTTKGVSAT